MSLNHFIDKFNLFHLFRQNGTIFCKYLIVLSVDFSRGNRDMKTINQIEQKCRYICLLCHPLLLFVFHLHKYLALLLKNNYNVYIFVKKRLRNIYSRSEIIFELAFAHDCLHNILFYLFNSQEVFVLKYFRMSIICFHYTFLILTIIFLLMILTVFVSVLMLFFFFLLISFFLQLNHLCLFNIIILFHRVVIVFHFIFLSNKC